MSKSSLITVLALIASVSAKPYFYSYGTFPLEPRAAYTAAELYNPAAVAPLSAAYSAGYPTAYSAAYPTAYSAAYSSYPASYAAPLSGAYTAPLPLSAVSAYSSAYTIEELAALYNPVSAIAPVAPVAAVAPVAPVAAVAPVAPVAAVAPVAPVAPAPLTYASPYSYVSQLYK